jgi:hypothetical protein
VQAQPCSPIKGPEPAEPPRTMAPRPGRIAPDSSRRGSRCE